MDALDGTRVRQDGDPNNAQHLAPPNLQQQTAQARLRPGAHPESAFRNLQATRRDPMPSQQQLTANLDGRNYDPSAQQQYGEQRLPYIPSLGAGSLTGGYRHDDHYAVGTANTPYGNDPFSQRQYHFSQGGLGQNSRGIDDRDYHNTGVHGRPPGGAIDYNDGHANQQSQLEQRSQQWPSEGPHYSPVAAQAYQDPNNVVTPGADNFSSAAVGGMAGIAYTVADRTARESGLDAMRGSERWPSSPVPAGILTGQGAIATASRSGQIGQNTSRQANYIAPDNRSLESYSYSSSSLTPLDPAAAPPARSTFDTLELPTRSPYGDIHHSSYRDDPYLGLSRLSQTNLGVFDPNEIDDDGDDGFDLGHQQRRSMLSPGDRGSRLSGVSFDVAGTAESGSAISLSRRPVVAGGGQYDPLGSSTAYNGAAGLPKIQAVWHGEKPRRKKTLLKVAIIMVVILVVAGAIIGGLVGGGVLKFGSSASNSGRPGGLSSTQDTLQNGDLNINSPEIEALLNNPNLHKIFPGIDYTPINTQYPACLTYPPSQNNVTRDVAVLSQLTNTLRLYGTDCNQTEMVLHAISQLQLNSTMKVWLGVWQDNNATTNARQLEQMYTVLEKNGQALFKGVIVANEILFRQQMTSAQLAQLLLAVKANFTTLSITLPVATSDLGTTWDATIDQASDLLMANIHPFFGGSPARNAAAWTWNFWTIQDAQWWRTDKTKNIIAETGWPTSGGTDCGSATVKTCPDGAVASFDGLNQFLQEWACQALANGTEYFWFEAFDEPWKVSYDTEGAAWEDQWGLLDVNRNLKAGITIPSCGGVTVL